MTSQREVHRKCVDACCIDDIFKDEDIVLSQIGQNTNITEE
jgi:hypothetical protein